MIVGELLIGKGMKLYDVSNNAISTTGCEAISKYLADYTDLEYFYANNCGFSQVLLSIANI